MCHPVKFVKKHPWEAAGMAAAAGLGGAGLAGMLGTGAGAAGAGVADATAGGILGGSADAVGGAFAGGAGAGSVAPAAMAGAMPWDAAAGAPTSAMADAMPWASSYTAPSADPSMLGGNTSLAKSGFDGKAMAGRAIKGLAYAHAANGLLGGGQQQQPQGSPPPQTIPITNTVLPATAAGKQGMDPKMMAMLMQLMQQQQGAA